MPGHKKRPSLPQPLLQRLIHRAVFELTHTRFNQKITKLAKKHHVLSGKWLFFSSRGQFSPIPSAC